jgi:outer membrane protein assembly factor BamB
LDSKENPMIPRLTTRPMKQRARVLALAAIATAIVGSCGNDSESATTAISVESPDPTGTAPSTPIPTTPGAASETEVCPAGEYPAYGAFDLASGVLQWSTCSPDETYRMVLGASPDVVLVMQPNDSGADTIALDAESGEELWKMSTARGLGIAPGPVVGQGVAVIETAAEGPPFVMGVDIATGAERWRIDPGLSVIGQTDDVVVVTPTEPLLPQPSPGSPLGGPLTGDMRGIDRATGAEIWTNDLFIQAGLGGTAFATSAVSNNVIAVTTMDGLAGVDLTSGAVLWTAPQLDQPTASEGVFVGWEPSTGAAPSLRALDATTGAELWTAQGAATHGGPLAVGDGVVVVLDQSGKYLIAYDLVTGAERWRVERTSPGEPQLTVGQSTVLLWEADLGVLSTTDGSRTWSATEPLRSPLMNNAGANESTVFVAVNSLPWSD